MSDEATEREIQHWFLFSEGRLRPTEEPAWASEVSEEGSWDGVLRANGFTAIASEGDPDCLFGCTIYGKDERDCWLCEFTDSNLGFHVTVDGFPDLLDFLAKIAPILTIGRFYRWDLIAHKILDEIMPRTKDWRGSFRG